MLVAFDSNAVEGTVTTVNPVYGTGAALIVEIVLTAVFLAIILQASRSDKMQRSAFTAIALALVAIHVAAIPISGASVNPARSFGPALVGTDFTDLWLYFVAPAAGAVLGWVVHKVVVMGDTNLRGDRTAAPTIGAIAFQPVLRLLGRPSGRPNRILEQRLDPGGLQRDVVCRGCFSRCEVGSRQS